MQKYAKILLATVVLSSISQAGGMIKSKMPTGAEKVNTESKTIDNKILDRYSLGISKIILGDTYHKAIYLSSRTEYEITERVSVGFLGESNYYRHLGDIHEMEFFGLDLGYKIPYTFDKLSVNIAAGLGSNFNYNRLFTDFRKSFDFGFAYQATLNYNINDDWSLSATYSKFDFNTNATQLEDTQPEIVSLSVGYKFDAMSFLK